MGGPAVRLGDRIDTRAVGWWTSAGNARLLRGVAHGDVASLDAETRIAVSAARQEKKNRDGGYSVSAIARFAACVVGVGACELWTGAKRSGYGQFKIGGKTVTAHRWRYEESTGRELRRAVVVRQSCGNRGCVAIPHLFEAPNRESLVGRRNGRWPPGGLVAPPGLLRRASLPRCYFGHLSTESHCNLHVGEGHALSTPSQARRELRSAAVPAL